MYVPEIFKSLILSSSERLFFAPALSKVARLMSPTSGRLTSENRKVAGGKDNQNRNIIA